MWPVLGLLSFVTCAYVAVVAAMSSWSKRQRWIAGASDRRIWAARRSSAFVGVASRRELVHLPLELEELVVDAQRIRRTLVPLDELRPDSRRALWEWLAALARLERQHAACIERLDIRHAAIAGRLESVWGAPLQRAVKTDGALVRGWLHQLIIVDQELWSFIRAARGPGVRAYR
jgi:hypothetical protein